MNYKILSVPGQNQTQGAGAKTYKILSLPEQNSTPTPAPTPPSDSATQVQPQPFNLFAGMQDAPFSKAGLQQAAPLKNLAIGAGNVAQGVIDNSPVLGAMNRIFGAVASPLISGAKGISDAIGNSAGNALKSILGPDKTKALAGAINNNPVSKAAVGLANDPNVQSGLDSVNKVATLAGDVVMAKGAIDAAPDTAAKIKSTIQEKYGPKYIENAKSDWRAPAESPKSTYGKAGKILQKAEKFKNNIPDVIVKNGIKVQDNVTDGVFDTKNTADQIRTDAAKASHEMLRPSLQLADQSPNAPKISADDITKATIKQIQQSNVQADEMEAQIAQAESKGAALKRRYPNGLSLTDAHDEKINYTSNRYSPVGPKSDTNAATVDRAFGRSLGSSVETNAPEGLKGQVSAFNAELTKQFQVADYLQELNGKKVPMYTWTRIRNYTGRIAGVGVTNTLLPGVGGILADVAGYHIGGMVETMLENMSGPFKSEFLSNLKTANPAAFDAINAYIKSGGTPTLALPAGSPSAAPNQAVFPNITPQPPTTYEKSAPMNNYQSSLPWLNDGNRAGTPQ